MSTEIIFYLLPENNMDACLRSICQLVAKYYHPEKKIYLRTSTPTMSQQLDDLLWTFHDISFLPHQILANNLQTTSAPILLSDKLPSNAEGDVLFNLSDEIPSFYARFKQVIEIIVNDEKLKAAGRIRYKYYKEHGCNIIKMQ